MRLKQQRAEKKAAAQAMKTIEKEVATRARTARTYEAVSARAAKAAEAAVAKRSRIPRSVQRAISQWRDIKVTMSSRWVLQDWA